MHVKPDRQSEDNGCPHQLPQLLHKKIFSVRKYWSMRGLFYPGLTEYIIQVCQTNTQVFTLYHSDLTTEFKAG